MLERSNKNFFESFRLCYALCKIEKTTEELVMKQIRYFEFPLKFKHLLYQFEENLASDYGVFDGEITITQHFITLTGYVGIVIEINEDFEIMKRVSIDIPKQRKYMRLHKERGIYLNRSLESIINEQYLKLLEDE